MNGWLDHTSNSAARQSETLFTSHADKGNYPEALAAYSDLQSSFPAYAVSLEARKVYGMALLKTGKMEEAAAVLSGILMEMEPSTEERSLRRVVADG